MHRLYVSNLHPHAEEWHIRQVFSAFGPIPNITLKRGHAFVHYNNLRELEHAMHHLNGKDLMGHKMVITHDQKPSELAKKYAKVSSNSDRKRFYGNMFGTRKWGYGGEKEDEPITSKSRRLENDPDNPKEKQTSGIRPGILTKWQINLRNVESRLTAGNVKEFLRNYPDIISVETHKRKKGTGSLIVENKRCLKHIIKKIDGAMLNGKFVHVTNVAEVSQMRRSKSRSRSSRSQSLNRSKSRGSRSSSSSGSSSSSSSQSSVRRTPRAYRSDSSRRRSCSTSDRSTSRLRSPLRSMRSPLRPVRSRSHSVISISSTSRSPSPSHYRRTQGSRTPDRRTHESRTRDHRTQGSRTPDRRTQDSRTQDRRTQDRRTQDRRTQDSRILASRTQDHKTQDMRNLDHRSHNNGRTLRGRYYRSWRGRRRSRSCSNNSSSSSSSSSTSRSSNNSSISSKASRSPNRPVSYFNKRPPRKPPGYPFLFRKTK